MPRWIRVAGCALVLMLLAGAIPAPGAEGRTPIWKPIVLGPGSTGKYIVTRPIVGLGGPVISIVGSGTENIDIDLNGMTLSGSPGVNVVDVTNVRTFVLRNGTIEGGPEGPSGDAVHVSTGGEVVIEDLTIQVGVSTGIAVFQNFPELAFAIRRNVIYEPRGDGIIVMGAGQTSIFTGTIEDNVIKDAVGSGIVVDNGAAAGLPEDHMSVAIRNNRVDVTVQGPGIFLLGSSAGAGTFIGNCLVIENTVMRAATDGISLDHVSDCKLHNNVIYESACNGISWLGGGNGLISDNIASNNGLNGVYSRGVGNHVDKNVMNENQCFGLFLDNLYHNYGRNTARNNLGQDATCPTGQSCDIAACINPHLPRDCWPQSTGPPAGPGNFPPELCDSDLFGSNHSFCDNLMPGPPPS